jgi:autotransporter family porin
VEIVPANAAYNRTTGQRVGPGLFPAGDSPDAGLLAPLISGDFTGTTQQILEWAACKWGISDEVVFAQAAAESSWQQNDLGDYTNDPADCPPGHGLGADGSPGQCPESYGILQTKYILWKAAWPGIAKSTAMNADVTYAIWRSCFNGDEIWLRNSAPPGQPYQAGDLWGCVGRWFAGSWHTPAAEQYINRVQTLMKQQVWEQPGFGLGD